jgi:aminocarboxymuconate-semialdehyde decarboxylase
MTRSEFGDNTSIAFVSCSLLSATTGYAPAPAAPRTQPRRREVVVGGKRVKTIDVHAHCAVPEAMALMGLKIERPGTNLTPLLNMVTNVADRLRAMDEQGIDVEALSINPYWYKAERDVATRLIAIQNEKLAEACAANPDRFVAYASVALQYPDLAAQQLEEGMTRYGLRGAGIGGSVNGEELSDPKFHPFWAKAEQLGALVFIHPQATGVASQIGSRLQGNGLLHNVIGNPLETTIALSHLIFEGTLDRFPRLKICAAHGGGYLPSYAARSDHGCGVFPDQCAGPKDGPLKKKPTEYLKQMYFDNIVFTPEAMRHLVAEVGAGQLVVGTDYPYPWTKTAVDLVLATPGLNDAERIAILGGTAATLLGIKV